MSLGSFTIEQAAAIRSKKLPYYETAINSELTAAGREILVNYSKVPEDEIEKHVILIRDLAWETFPFACVGVFWFLECGLSQHPKYPLLLSRLCDPTPTSTTASLSPITENTPAPRLLDLGTCLGQDLRKLLYDGAPLAALYGSDILSTIETLGHALFRDATTFTPDHFIAGDIEYLSNPDLPLSNTAGAWDAVVAMMFLHLFSLPTQLHIATNMLRLLRPVTGSLVLGANSGSRNTGEWPLPGPFAKQNPDGTPASMYRHSRETMAQMWEEAGRAVGGEWAVWVDYDAEYHAKLAKKAGIRDPSQFFPADGSERVVFFVERLN